MSPRLYQYTRALNPFAGLAESVVTSTTLYLGDAAFVAWSLTTSSGTASRWTIQGFQGTDEDGWRVAIAAGDPQWQSAQAVTAQGYYSVGTIPAWARFQRTPSASSTTIRVAIRVGP